MEIAILGASVRAACHSALRAGLSPLGADLFADLDLRRHCPAVAVQPDDYPAGLLTFLKQRPGLPWMYTGALENRPALLRRLAEYGPLLGNPAHAVRRVRRPERLAEVLRSASLPCPALGGSPPGRRWLLKPRRSAAGSGVRPWTGGTRTVSPRCYVQERIEGDSHSALFLGDHAGALLLGVTRQLIGTDWLGASGFRYAGNVGPVPLAETTRQTLSRLGDVLAREFGLRGLFGTDFILAGDTPWPVEVNPRYTASVEVLEHALELPLLRWHVAAFTTPLPRPELCQRSVVGKAILYARHDGLFPQIGPWCEAVATPIGDLPAIADVPDPGSPMQAGRPILTLLHRAQDVASCLDALRDRAAETYRLLAGV